MNIVIFIFCFIFITLLSIICILAYNCDKYNNNCEYFSTPYNKVTAVIENDKSKESLIHLPWINDIKHSHDLDNIQGNIIYLPDGILITNYLLPWHFFTNNKPIIRKDSTIDKIKNKKFMSSPQAINSNLIKKYGLDFKKISGDPQTHILNNNLDPIFRLNSNNIKNFKKRYTKTYPGFVFTNLNKNDQQKINNITINEGLYKPNPNISNNKILVTDQPGKEIRECFNYITENGPWLILCISNINRNVIKMGFRDTIEFLGKHVSGIIIDNDIDLRKSILKHNTEVFSCHSLDKNILEYLKSFLENVKILPISKGPDKYLSFYKHKPLEILKLPELYI